MHLLSLFFITLQLLSLATPVQLALIMEQQASAVDFKKNVLLLKPGDVTKRGDRVLTPTLNTLSQLRKTEQFMRDVVFSRNMSAIDVRKKLVEAFPALENIRYMFLIVMLMQFILHSHQILNKFKVVPSLGRSKVT